MLPSLLELVNLHRRFFACEYWNSLLSDSSSSRVSRTSQVTSTTFFHIYLYVYIFKYSPSNLRLVSYLLISHLVWAKSRHFSVSSPFFSKTVCSFFDITQPRRAAFSLKKSIFPWVLPKKACQNIVFWIRIPKKNLKIFWQSINSYFSGLFLFSTILFLAPSLLVHGMSSLSFCCG